ncbi:MAG: hypothetical protein GF331_06990 [Chitinivibrionales bacterium]|nr:hypothetical protein [Chitinivibrionales bacterium]
MHITRNNQDILNALSAFLMPPTLALAAGLALCCACTEPLSPTSLDSPDHTQVPQYLALTHLDSVSVGLAFPLTASPGIVIYRDSVPLDTVIDANRYVDSAGLVPGETYTYHAACTQAGLSSARTPYLVVVVPAIEPSGTGLAAIALTVRLQGGGARGVLAMLTRLSNADSVTILLDSTGSFNSGLSLPPEQYRLSLARPGFAGWCDTVLLQEDDTLHVGPVTLRDTAAPWASVGPSHAVTLYDTVEISATYGDSFAGVASVTWHVIGDSGVTLPALGQSDTQRVWFVDPGEYSVGVTVVDSAGNSTERSALVSVIRDPPHADAGRDTVVFIDSLAPLSGSGSSDRYGSIQTYEWDIGGNGTFVEVSTGDTAISLTPPGSRCILRVTDDDGQQALDTVWIGCGIFSLVTDSLPFNRLWSFSCVVYDSLMWIIGGQYSSSSTWYRSRSVMSSPDGRTWRTTTANAAFGKRAWHASVVFDGRMWVLGGRKGTTRVADVWSSTDGTIWTEVSADGGYGPRDEHNAVVFGGKMWVVGGLGASDLWCSADGVDWQRMSALPGSCSARAQCAAFDGQLWLYDRGVAWHSADGINWTATTGVDTTIPGGQGRTVVHRGSVWHTRGATVYRSDDGAGPRCLRRPRCTPSGRCTEW